jgi:hypothetical protein
MLNRQTLLAALPLTERLDAVKMALHPVAGSPLDAMVNATRSDEGLFDAAQGNVEVFVSHIETMANKTQVAYGTSHHCATLDQIAAMAIAATTKHLQFAKMVVAPTINDLYTRVKGSLAEVNASSLLGMEVEVLREPAPLENPQLQSAVRKFDGMTIEDLPLSLHLPDQNAQELQALAMTGSAALDAAIAEWLSMKGDSFLFSIWEGVFQQKPLQNPKSFLQLITDRQAGVDNSLAIYLFARKLTDGKPPEGTQMSLGVFKQRIVDFRNQAGASLSRALDKIDRAMKNGVMVREVINGKTVVYEPLYRKFIEAGGTNEMLFANSMAGSYAVALPDLIAGKNNLAERWAMHAALVKTAESNQRFNKTKSFIELHFNSQLAEIAGTEEATQHNIEGVRRLFEGVMAGVRDSDMENLYALCLKVVCRARFYRSDAELILTGIEAAKRENPQLSVREAATISSISYVAAWGARMMKLVSI